MPRLSLLQDVVIAAIVLAVLLSIPWFHPSGFVADFGIRCASMALFATSLNLMVGYTGLVSFGHGLFFGLGAYAFALLMQRTGLSLPVALLATLLITAATSGLVGAICIRLRLIYFAFVTLAMQMLFYSIIISAQPLTGGDQGLQGGIPRRVVLGLNFGDQWKLYGASCIVLVLGLLLMRHIVASPFGASMRMVRDNEARATFLGIAVWRVKLTAFVLSAVFASLGGVVMSLFVAGAYPELANWPQSGQAVFAIMLGGIGSFLGPLVGTVVLLLLNDTAARLTEYYGLVLGIVILAVALGLRKGILDFATDFLHRPRPRPPAVAIARRKRVDAAG
jgi:branched-chain amino acid transport system permease protein